MRVLFVNNDGGGFADYVEAARQARLWRSFLQNTCPAARPQTI